MQTAQLVQDLLVAICTVGHRARDEKRIWIKTSLQTFGMVAWQTGISTNYKENITRNLPLIRHLGYTLFYRANFPLKAGTANWA